VFNKEKNKFQYNKKTRENIASYRPINIFLL
jgi:hypothetical protein